MERELYFTDEFLPRLTERLQVVLFNIKNHVEIQESDMQVMESVHRIWFEDRLGWRKEDLSEKQQIVIQQGLFSATTADGRTGEATNQPIPENSMVIDNDKVITKKRKRK